MSLQPDEEISSRRRRPNWTEQECLLLAQLMQERKHIIKGRYSTGISIQDKKHAWEEIVQTVNAAFPQVQRTVSDCSKKWENLLAKAKEEIKRQKKQAVRGEPLSLEQLSAVTQKVISVMNLSDMLQQGKEDSYVLEMMQTQQNSCAEDENDLTINENLPNKQEQTEQTSLTEQKFTLTNVSNSLTVGFNGPRGATFTGSGEHLETSRPTPPSAQCTTLQERVDLEMSVLRRQEAVLKLQQEYYTLKIRLLKKQIEESTQKH